MGTNGRYPARERWLKRKAQFARLPEWADKLVRGRVKYYLGAAPKGVEGADLYAAGWCGVLRGVASYQRGHGTTLRTWARHCIESELRHWIRMERSARGHKAWQQDRHIGGMREVSMADLSAEQREVLECNQSRQEFAAADWPDYAARLVAEENIDRLYAELPRSLRRVLFEWRKNPDVPLWELTGRLRAGKGNPRKRMCERLEVIVA